jgi:hypothetical protein
MNTFLFFVIPSVLVIIGMILNNLKLVYDQPESSPEQDPAKRLAAEKEAYRKFFDLQRTRFLKRQKRVGQYAWFVLVTFLVSSGWMYFDTVNKTTESKQIAAIQTVPVVEGKDVVLSLTLSDGNNVKYLIKKSEKASTSGVAVKEGLSKEPVPSWEVSRLGTALSIGEIQLPLGIALKISN